MRERSSFGWLVCILIIATFFRLYHLETAPPGLHPQEAASAMRGADLLRGGNTSFDPLSLSTAAAFAVFGEQPWAARVPGAFFGILTAIGVYLVGRDLFSKRVGLFSAFFSATGVWHIILSRSAFEETLVPFFAVFGAYFLHRAIEKFEKGCRFPREIFVTLVLVVLLLLPLVSSSEWTTAWKEIGANSFKTAGILHIRGDLSPLHNLPGRPLLFWPVGLLFFWGVLLGLKSVFSREHDHLMTVDHESEQAENWESMRNTRRSFLMLFGWTVLALLIASFSTGAPDAFRAALLIVPAYMFAGIGGIAVYTFFKIHMPSSVLRIGTALFLVFLIYEAYQTYFVLWAGNPVTAKAFNAEAADIGNILNRLPPATPKGIVLESIEAEKRADTIKFTSGAWREEDLKAKNIYYTTPAGSGSLPAKTVRFYLK
jgi:4-amino-4-deoxy-L-arabinose transferase-like glycosyltransferase